MVNDLPPSLRARRSGEWLEASLERLKELHETSPRMRVVMARRTPTGDVAVSAELLLESVEVAEGGPVMYRRGPTERDYEIFVAAAEEFLGFYLVPSGAPVRFAMPPTAQEERERATLAYRVGQALGNALAGVYKGGRTR